MTGPGRARRWPSSIAPAAWCALLLSIVFLGSFGLHRYFDDWMFPLNAEDALAGRRTLAFVLSPVGQHWSPLWNAFEIVNVGLAGLDSDALIRSAAVAATACACWWFWRVAAALGLSPPAAAFGVSIVALHHVNAAAVYSFDTWSQTTADLLTWIVAGRLLMAVVDRDRPLRAGEAGGLALLTGVALLIKEEALAAVASVAWLTFVAFADGRTTRGRPAIAGLCIAVTLVAAAFALLRRSAGAAFDADGALRLCVACAPLNVVTLLGLLALPVRGLVVADALRLATPATIARLVIVAAATAALIGALAAGLVRGGSEETRRTRLATAGLLVASTFPTVLLGHVGELYAHTGVFWLALLSADAFDSWRAFARSRAVPFAIAAAYAVSLAVGLRANLSDMRATGELARTWLDRYAAALAETPDNAVALVHGGIPQKNDGDYSLYRLTNPEYVMLELTTVLERRAGDRVRVAAEWTADRADLARTLASGPVYDVWRRGTAVTVAARAAE